MNTSQTLKTYSWLNPKSRKLLTEAVRQQINSETKERLIRNPGSDIDYGFSFPGLNDLKIECLEEIRNNYTATGKRPHVADIGAGFGSMTWKLLAAGAKVDAFEIQKPTAEELKRRISNINPYFWEEDNLEEILHVFPENALTTLCNAEFNQQYDFVWIAQVLHFLTPAEIQQLSILLQVILKPGGRVFAEANAIYTFQSIDTNNCLKSAYEKTKSEGITSPYIFTINSLTLINQTTHQVLHPSIVDVYNQNDMQKYNIPLRINAYGYNYLGPVKEDLILKKFNDLKQQYPGHQFVINRFHQIITLLDEETTNLCFTQAGFDCTSYHYNPVTGQKLIGSPVSEVTYSFCVKLHKPPELICQDELSDSSNNTINLLPSSSLFNESHHDRLILELETNCKNKAANASLLEAASNRDYALALRKACAVGNLLLIKSILKYKNSLDININLPSATNGFTALDWINASQKVDFLTKERIISLLLRNGAESGIIEDTPQHISQIH